MFVLCVITTVYAVVICPVLVLRGGVDGGFEKGKELILRGNFTPGYMRRGVMDFRWKKEEFKNWNPGVSIYGRGKRV